MPADTSLTAPASVAVAPARSALTEPAWVRILLIGGHHLGNRGCVTVDVVQHERVGGDHRAQGVALAPACVDGNLHCASSFRKGEFSIRRGSRTT